MTEQGAKKRKLKDEREIVSAKVGRLLFYHRQRWKAAVPYLSASFVCAQRV